MTAITGKAIDRKIATFTTNRDKLRDMAHEVLVMIINHSAPEEAGPDAVGAGDTTRALKMLKALPASWSEQADAWLRAFTPIRVIVKNDKHGFDPEYKKIESREKKLEAWDLEGAASTPFYEFAKERAPVAATDFDAAIKGVEAYAKRLEKRVKDGEVKPEDADSIAAVASVLRGLKFARIVADQPPAENANEAPSGDEAAPDLSGLVEKFPKQHGEKAA